MFERISRGIELTRQSWQVLREEKTLLAFPLLSGIACTLVLVTFAVPTWLLGVPEAIAEDPKDLQQNPLLYVVLFAFYFVNYFVIVYFNSALISCAILRFHGQDAKLSDGLSAANARLPQIAGWALVSATVGIILKAIESRSERAGQFAANLIGAGWAIATYFVVPVLVVEGLGPINAVKRSFAILRKTWGESLVSRFGIGLVVSLATLVAILPAALGLISGNVIAAIVGIAITAVLVITVSLVASALNSIIIAALYLYAAEGQVPAQFDRELLENAYGPKGS
jgi:hypothetical protein